MGRPSNVLIGCSKDVRTFILRSIRSFRGRLIWTFVRQMIWIFFGRPNTMFSRRRFMGDPSLLDPTHVTTDLLTNHQVNYIRNIQLINNLSMLLRDARNLYKSH